MEHTEDCYYGENFSWDCNACLIRQAGYKLEQADWHYEEYRWHESRTASLLAQACVAVANARK